VLALKFTLRDIGAAEIGIYPAGELIKVFFWPLP